MQLVAKNTHLLSPASAVCLTLLTVALLSCVSNTTDSGFTVLLILPGVLQLCAESRSLTFCGPC